MSLALCFWVLMVVWLAFAFAPGVSAGARSVGSSVLLFLLFALLGWQVFGAAIHR